MPNSTVIPLCHSVVVGRDNQGLRRLNLPTVFLDLWKICLRNINKRALLTAFATFDIRLVSKAEHNGNECVYFTPRGIG